MSFLTMWNEATGIVPKLPTNYAQTLVNRAWRDVRRQSLWSFLMFEANWTSPGIINAGTVSVVQGQTTITFNAAATAALARDVVGHAPVYLSFDIDALDPAFAPGTGTPEIGGLASWQAQAILRGLEGLAWAGMDVVEVAPAYDVAEITALAAATMAWEYLALVAGAP